MLFSRTSVLFALATSVAAAPLEKRWFRGGFGGWGNDAHNSINSWWDAVKRHSLGDFVAQEGQCDLSSVSLPKVNASSTGLPPPSAGLSLYHVAVGRGTQNYTCDLSNATAVPVSAGALATLFNFTCMSAQQSTLLAKLTSIAIDLPCPSSDDSASIVTQMTSGHHYFTDATTAYFNLDTSLYTYGQGAFGKINSTLAPKNAVVGQYNQGYGAVPWLKLQAKDSDSCVFHEVYRVKTAGGSPPATCQGQQAAFEIPYSAEYWFYS